MPDQRLGYYIIGRRSNGLMIANRIERIKRRAPRVPQRTANDGHDRAATVNKSAEQIQWAKTFSLVTGSSVAS
jgi:hypothetical protein